MTKTTAPTVLTVQRCQGHCNHVRPLFDFYSLGTKATDPRSVCKECRKTVNAKAHQRRQQRRDLLGHLKNSQLPT